MIELILSSFWFILPAGIANMFPVILSKVDVIQKYNQPIDFNLKFKGKPIFGKGKTWFGFISGGLIGGLVGLVQSSIHITYVTLPNTTLGLGLLLGFGALTGDLIGSLIKRRLNIERGGKAPLLDQLDFLLGALLFGSLITFKWEYLIVLGISIPGIHILLNRTGYEMGLKEEPW